MCLNWNGELCAFFSMFKRISYKGILSGSKNGRVTVTPVLMSVLSTMHLACLLPSVWSAGNFCNHICLTFCFFLPFLPLLDSDIKCHCQKFAVFVTVFAVFIIVCFRHFCHWFAILVSLLLVLSLPVPNYNYSVSIAGFLLYTGKQLLGRHIVIELSTSLSVHLSSRKCR